MRPSRKITLIIGSILLLFALFIAGQYSFRGRPPERNDYSPPVILAHRGVHQNYEKGGYDIGTGCEAAHIFPPVHGYIENTIESIGAAFAYGASIVEIDIRKTADSNLVVMHDYLLGCRTNGEGKVSDHDVAYLKSLDIGYGYSFDGGKTFPLRGKGIGKMPALDEVLREFPEGVFLIDHKDGDEESTNVLIGILEKLEPECRARILYWGPSESLSRIRARFPEIRQFFIQRYQVHTFGTQGRT